MEKDFQTFNNFLAENNIAEILIEIDKGNVPIWEALSDEIKKTFEMYGVEFPLREDIGKTGDDFASYGVKGKLKAKGEAKKTDALVPGAKVDAEDSKVLASIDNKITQGIKIFGELEEFMIEYGKVNSRPISDILAKMKAFQEALSNEIGNM